MALYISRLEIRNFRNFAHLVLDPFPPQAVIVGENGAGKSNLLHALRLVLDPTLSDAARVLRDEDIWEGHPQGLARGVVVTVSISLAGYDDDDDAKAVLSSSTVEVHPYSARLTYRFAPRQAIAVDESGAVDPVLTNIDRPLTPQDYDVTVYGGDDEGNDVRRVRRDVGIRVLHALRDAESDLQNWRRNPLRELLERLPLDPANLDATADAVALAVKQLSTDKNVALLEQQLAGRLTDMVGPRVPIEATLGFASTQPDELVRAVRLFVDKEMRRGIADTSLGSANVAYLCLLIEALAQQRSHDLFVATLLGVEEPEAHLHVSLQRRLFSYLLRSEQGLILTTHSPHIAAVAPLNSFVLLRGTEAGAVGTTTAGLPVNDAVRADLERYLDVTRAEVLFANVVILVEGIAESYIIPAIAKALNFDLDSYGVVVSSVHGADFAPYRALLGAEGLNIPHVIVTDGDATGDRRGRREAGLKRAARLNQDQDSRRAMLSRINGLPTHGEGDYQEQRAELVCALAADAVFVGRQTLETDLCEMFGEEMKAAFAEVQVSPTAREEFEAGVDNELSDEPTEDGRAAMLTRVTAIGKGRFSQRLAAHIENIDLGEWLESEYELDLDGEPDAADLTDIAPGWHVISALEHVSQLTRKISLFSHPNDSDDIEQ